MTDTPIPVIGYGLENDTVSIDDKLAKNEQIIRKLKKVSKGIEKDKHLLINASIVLSKLQVDVSPVDVIVGILDDVKGKESLVRTTFQILDQAFCDFSRFNISTSIEDVFADYNTNEQEIKFKDTKKTYDEAVEFMVGSCQYFRVIHSLATVRYKDEWNKFIIEKTELLKPKEWNKEQLLKLLDSYLEFIRAKPIFDDLSKAINIKQPEVSDTVLIDNFRDLSNTASQVLRRLFEASIMEAYNNPIQKDIFIKIYDVVIEKISQDAKYESLRIFDRKKLISCLDSWNEAFRDAYIPHEKSKNFTLEEKLKLLAHGIAARKFRDAIGIGAEARGTYPIDLRNEVDISTQRLFRSENYHHYESRLRNKKKQYISLYGGAGNVQNGVEKTKERIKKHLTHAKKPFIDKLKFDFECRTEDEIEVKLKESLEQELSKLECNDLRIATLKQFIEKYFFEIKFLSPVPEDEVSQLLRIQGMMSIQQILDEFSKQQTRTEDAIQSAYLSVLNITTSLVADMMSLNNNLLPSQQGKSSNVLNPDRGKFLGEYEECTSQTIIDKSGRQSFYTALSTYDKDKRLAAYYPQLRTYNSIVKKICAFSLPSVLNDGDEKGYFEITGKKSVAKTYQSNKDEPILLLGRNSETKYEFTTEIIERLEKEIEEWSSNQPKKLLALDITIEKKDDELIKLINSPAIKKLVLKGCLDILVFKSGQKQTSLGIGKFSSGSSFLITNDKGKLEDINQASEEQEITDHNIVNFYTTHMTDRMQQIVDKQIENAKYLQQKLATILPNSDIRVIQNGPFIILEGGYSGEYSREACEFKEHLYNIFPKSESFGFYKTTSTTWSDTSIRISPGLESKETLDLYVSLLSKRLSSIVEDPTEEKTPQQWRP